MLVFYVYISKQVPKLTVRKIFFGVFAGIFFFALFFFNIHTLIFGFYVFNVNFAVGKLI